MKRIILLLTLSACASTKGPTTEDLMRESYMVGCGEEALQHLESVGDEFKSEVGLELDECRKRASKFNLEQTGIYVKPADEK